MSATVRSVDVRLNAHVNDYVAKMKLAGRETDRAFDRADRTLDSTNRRLDTTRDRLDLVSRSSVRTSTSITMFDRNARRLDLTMHSLALNSGRAGSEIDTMSGRLGIFLRLAGALGPALVPIGAAGVPAVAGLTVGLGAAVGALGVTLLAVNGLGDAMKALDAYQLEPTTANLQKLREEMDRLGPTAAHFVRYLDSIEPQLKSLQEAARQGLLPGWEAGIDAMLGRLPQVRQIIRSIADEMGLLSTQAGQELAGGRFDAFFDYLETDAAPTLRAFAQSTGYVVSGISNMIVAFAPLTRGFTGGLVEMTRAFADWSAGLDDNSSFQGFLNYVQATGPQVVAFFGQLVMALSAVVEAAAPVGQVLLPILTAVARAIELIADSDLGTPLMAGLAALSAVQLATMAWGKIAGSTIAGIVAGNARAAASYLTVTTATQRATMSASALAAMEAKRNRAALVGAGKFAGVLAGLTVASTGAGDSLGVTNAASMALMGSFAGPWGAAIGGAVGLTLDLAGANDGLEAAIRRTQDAAASTDLTVLREELRSVAAETESTEERWNGLNKAVLAIPVAGSYLSQYIGEKAEADAAAGEAAEEHAEATLKAAEANARYARQARIAGVNAGYTATEIRGMVDAMEENRSEALAAFDAVTQYSQALVDARKQAEKSNAGIRDSNDLTREQRLEVIANREALSGLISAWNNQGKAVANNVREYRDARAELIQTAREMGATRAQARRLADQYMDIPRRILTNIEMRGGQEALDEMARIERQAQDVAGEYRISFIVTQLPTSSPYAQEAA